MNDPSSSSKFPVASKFRGTLLILSLDPQFVAADRLIPLCSAKSLVHLALDV